MSKNLDPPNVTQRIVGELHRRTDKRRFLSNKILLAGVEITLQLDACKAQCVRRGKRKKCAGSFWQHPSGTRILDSARYISVNFIAVLELASSSSTKTGVHGVLITTNLLKFQCHLKSKSQGVFGGSTT